MTRPALFAALLLALAMPLSRAAEAPLGVFTIVEGEVLVLRESREFAAVEGQRLRAEDIVRSRDGARVARIELDDGTLLDIGPATELLLQPRAFAAPAELGTSLYLLRGWLKVTTASAQGGQSVALAAPQIGVARVAGSLVVHATAKASLVFVESGRADVLDRSADKPGGTAHGLGDSDTFVARAGAPGELLRRPPRDLLEGLPRAFADSLPRRAAQWRSRTVEPGTAAAPRYQDVAPWLHAEPALRAAFVKRFAALAHEPSFRTGLVAGLREHPEWARVLFPEKYRPKIATTTLAHRSATPQTSAPASTPAPTPTRPAGPNPEPALAQAPAPATETP
jgi:hypothetical protein